jgi:hypothetical protein
VLLYPANINKENTVKTEPRPANQKPFLDVLNAPMRMPNRTPITPTRNKIRRIGIWRKLRRYLKFLKDTSFVVGSTANP